MKPAAINSGKSFSASMLSLFFDNKKPITSDGLLVFSILLLVKQFAYLMGRT
jgi:hypothetical protein